MNEKAAGTRVCTAVFGRREERVGVLSIVEVIEIGVGHD